MYFEKFLNAFVKLPKISRKILYIWNLQITCFKIIYHMHVFLEFEIFLNFQNWPKFRVLRENAYKVLKSKYFRDILNDSDSPINSLSGDI